MHYTERKVSGGAGWAGAQLGSHLLLAEHLTLTFGPTYSIKINVNAMNLVRKTCSRQQEDRPPQRPRRGARPPTACSASQRPRDHTGASWAATNILLTEWQTAVKHAMVHKIIQKNISYENSATLRAKIKHFEISNTILVLFSANDL